MATFETRQGDRTEPLGPVAVSVSDVWKEFRVYREHNQSIKEIFLRRKRASFESFWALKGVSFDVKEGTAFGLIGENGSGKSTMLKIMAKILRPQQGSVSLNGKVSALLELGTGFHPDLTGRENIYLNGSILGLSRKEIDSRYDQIVEFSELEHFIDMPVKNYSSGMYVRLGFAVATNVDPDILLIDEILAVGDEAFQRKSMEKLYELKSQKKTIIVVSHALSSIADICDDAVWIDSGEIKAAGQARKVVDTYLKEVNRQEEERSVTGSGKKKDEQVGSRYGSGEIVLDSVRLLDGSGSDKTIFQTGEKLIIRLDYTARKIIEWPVFGIAIHTRSGILCAGTNSHSLSNEAIPGNLQGSGVVECVIDSLHLLGGEYLLTVVVHDLSGMHIFDQHEQRYIFRVAAVDNHDVGLFKTDCRWEIMS